MINNVGLSSFPNFSMGYVWVVGFGARVLRENKNKKKKVYYDEIKFNN